MPKELVSSLDYSLDLCGNQKQKRLCFFLSFCSQGVPSDIDDVPSHLDEMLHTESDCESEPSSPGSP
jgi:hypothetical protein